MIKKILVGVLAMILTACNGNDIDFYKNKGPKLDIREYLNGDIVAKGMLQGRNGNIKRTFTADIKGSWIGNKGKLEEIFIFDDGEKQSRVWNIDFNEQDEVFTATAGDVIGTAKGLQRGNAVNMVYVLRIPVGDKEYDIKINDWLYLIDEKTLINKSTLSKFGLNVGTLTISFDKK